MPIHLPSIACVLALLAASAASRSTRAADAAPPATADRLKFADQEVLAGELVGFTPERGILWRHAKCPEPFLVNTDRLDTLLLRQGKAAPAAADKAGGWLVSLRNGDAVAGRIVSLAQGVLVLDSPAIGKLEIPTGAIATLVNPGSSAVHGIGKAEDWQIATDQSQQARILAMLRRQAAGGDQEEPPPAPARIVDGALAIPVEGISRALEIPAQSRLELTFEKGGASSVDFFATKGQTTESCTFDFRGKAVVISKTTRSANWMRSTGRETFELKRKNPPRSLAFITDAKNARVTLEVDGQKVGIVDLPMDRIGKNLLLRNRRNSSAMLTGLTLRRALPPAADVGTDAVLMANGDRLAGTLIGIADGKMSLKTEISTFDLPFERMQQVTLHASETKPPAAGKNPVVVVFDDLGHLTFDVTGIKDGKLTGSAIGLPQASLNLDAVRKLVFNPGATMPSRDPVAIDDTQGENDEGEGFAPFILRGVPGIPNVGQLQVPAADIQVFQIGGGELPGKVEVQVLSTEAEPENKPKKGDDTPKKKDATKEEAKKDGQEKP